MNLAEIRARMALLMTESKGLIEKFPDFLFSDTERDRMVAIDKELGDLKGKLDGAKQSKAMADRLAQFSEYMDTPAAGSGPEFPAGKADDSAGEGAQGKAGSRDRKQSKSVSQLLLSDGDYSEWFKKMAPHGAFSEKVRVASPQVSIPGGLKALVTGSSDSSAGAFIFNDVQQNLNQFITRRPLVMRDVITIGTTAGDLIEYVRQVSETNNAAMVPEATSTAPIGDGTGGTTTAALGGVKPESGMVFERVTTPVKTVAHWMPATKRSLADAGQMSTLIDSFLRYGLEEELEDQMVLGDGSGENFDGLTNLSGVTSQAWDTNLLVTTRRARTKVRLVGRAAPTAYLLNPYDWENIQLIRADEDGASGPFLFGGPAANEVPTLWNLPVVECESVPQGVGYVGNFKTLILWDREQAGVQITDSHNDFFVRNLIAILAEARAAFGCLKPSAIVEMDLDAA